MSDKTVFNKENVNTYDRLFVTLEAGLGSLQILLAVCDDMKLRERIIREYEKELGLSLNTKIYHLALNRQEPSLLQTMIDAKIGNIENPTRNAVATVIGVEEIASFRNVQYRQTLNKFLGYLQWSREALRNYPLPIVLWLPSHVLPEIAKYAPDFWSWRAGTFTFNPESRTSHEINFDLVLPLETDTSTNQRSSIFSLQQLQSSLVEALSIWREDSPNIEPIYAQLGKAYAERVWKKQASDSAQETILAETYLNKAISLQKLYKRKSDLAYSISTLAYMYSHLGYWNKAESFYRQALILFEELGDSNNIAHIMGELGDIERNRGKLNAAESLYRQCLELEQTLGNESGIASAWDRLGYIEKNRGNLSDAEVFYRKSLSLREKLGDRDGIAIIWGLLADIERNRYNIGL
jgi:tetratricopeptide (TPR) repeat protein